MGVVNLRPLGAQSRDQGGASGPWTLIGSPPYLRDQDGNYAYSLIPVQVSPSFSLDATQFVDESTGSQVNWADKEMTAIRVSASMRQAASYANQIQLQVNVATVSNPTSGYQISSGGYSLSTSFSWADVGAGFIEPWAQTLWNALKTGNELLSFIHFYPSGSDGSHQLFIDAVNIEVTYDTIVPPPTLPKGIITEV
jgi:hypothetical protein